MTRHSDTCDWQLLESKQDGFNEIIRIRSEIPPNIKLSDYPILINLYWRLKEETANGMPTPEDNDKIYNLDNLLNDMDGPRIGFMMFAITGNQRKEWIWYIKYEKAFFESLNKCLSGHERFPIQIESGPAGDNWDAYNNIITAIR